MNTAKIVAITHPLIENTEGKLLTSEEFIAYAARVSNPSNQMNTQTSEKLLRYCIANKHFSIFEMVNCVMEIETTRDIGRQILRHRSFSFQEFSQRYADPTKTLGFVGRDAKCNIKHLCKFRNRDFLFFSFINYYNHFLFYCFDRKCFIIKYIEFFAVLSCDYWHACT